MHGYLWLSLPVMKRRQSSLCSNSLAEQDYPGDLLEIIIVNDNSTDRTPIVVSEFIAEHRRHSGINIRLIYNPFQGKKSAVRHGVEKSAGELILMTDADCAVGPGWVSAYAAFFAAGNADMIVGEVYQKPGRGFASHFGSFEFSALQAITEAAVLAGHPVMCNAANMAIRKDIYLKHAGDLRNDIASGDDIFLLHAVKRVGRHHHVHGWRCGGGGDRRGGHGGGAVASARTLGIKSILLQGRCHPHPRRRHGGVQRRRRRRRRSLGHLSKIPAPPWPALCHPPHTRLPHHLP